MVDSFGELEASSLFCVRCKRATPVRKKLLLVLPSGNKYDYTCSVCGTQVGGKTDSDSSDFHRVASASRTAPPPDPGRPASRQPFRVD
jgi:DNA-directed RNA polymerase subunit RPC12/RpoP